MLDSMQPKLTIKELTSKINVGIYEDLIISLLQVSPFYTEHAYMFIFILLFSIISVLRTTGNLQVDHLLIPSLPQYHLQKEGLCCSGQANLAQYMLCLDCHQGTLFFIQFNEND